MILLQNTNLDITKDDTAAYPLPNLGTQVAPGEKIVFDLMLYLETNNIFEWAIQFHAESDVNFFKAAGLYCNFPLKKTEPVSLFEKGVEYIIPVSQATSNWQNTDFVLIKGVLINANDANNIFWSVRNTTNYPNTEPALKVWENSYFSFASC